MNIRIQATVLLLFLFILLTSCSLERRIASEFIKEVNNQSIVLQFPNDVIKSNLKIDSVRASKISDPDVLDALRYAESLVLKYVDDSIFLASCKQNMVEELKAYGLNVINVEEYDESSTDSLYFLNLAQIQLEEYEDSATIDKFCYGRSYFYDFILNAINVNSWFELSKFNVDNVKFPVLYSSYYQFDGVDGHCQKVFTRNGNKVMYNYKVDTIDVKLSYELAAQAGKRYASNLFDYLLNIHVQDHLPKDKNPFFYYHYDRRKNILRTVCEDAFVEMNP